MTAVIHKIYVGAEGKHTLSPEESLSRSVSFGKLRSQLIACEYVYHYGGEDTYSNASLTAATESLELSDNGFKTA